MVKSKGWSSTLGEFGCRNDKGILQGLAHLHNRRVIHRDLKPDNVLLQGDNPRLADFGLSRVLKSTSNSKNLAGTLDYMSPETLDGVRSEQGDIWAAGVILYLLITGYLPFKRNSRSAVVKAIIHDNPAPINVVLSSLLMDIIATSLRKDPDERFESATMMLNALAKCREYLHTAQEPTDWNNLSHRENSIQIGANDVDTLRYSQEASARMTDVVPVAPRPSNDDDFFVCQTGWSCHGVH